MTKNYFLIFLIFLLPSCMTPSDNENLQIKIIDVGLEIEISDIKNRINDPKFSNTIKGGSISYEEKKSIRMNMMIKQSFTALDLIRKLVDRYFIKV